MMAKSDGFFELERVSKRYGDVVAVDDLSLSIERGEFVTLLGPSGCGKTTTLRIMAGFERAGDGRVVLDGQVVNDVPPYRRDIGMVFQSYALFPHMKVSQNIEFGLKMRRMDKEERADRVAEALRLVRLEAMSARYPHELSGGQQQRVAIARALVTRPKLLLMDEPMSNLDALLRSEMQLELRDIIARVGVTTVNVTHNQEEALAMSDRVVVMLGGRIAQTGTPSEVYGRPASAFVATFLGRSNIFDCEVERSTDGLVHAGSELAGSISFAGKDMAAGRRIEVQLRPELIEIHRGERVGQVNQVRGRIRQVAYLGSCIDVLVEVKGKTMLARRPLEEGVRPFTSGDEVTLSWKSESVVPIGV
jgi:spermidine/putrescine ABC transporter ATP-binding subunit